MSKRGKLRGGHRRPAISEDNRKAAAIDRRKEFMSGMRSNAAPVQIVGGNSQVRIQVIRMKSPVAIPANINVPGSPGSINVIQAGGFSILEEAALRMAAAIRTNPRPDQWRAPEDGNVITIGGPDPLDPAKIAAEAVQLAAAVLEEAAKFEALQERIAAEAAAKEAEAARQAEASEALRRKSLGLDSGSEKPEPGKLATDSQEPGKESQSDG